MDMNRVNNLTEYVEGIMNKQDGSELYLKYKSDIGKVTPQEVFEIFYRQYNKGSQPKEILVFLDKIINVFYKSLVAYPWKRPAESSFIGVLMQENRALVQKLDSIKNIIKEKDFSASKKELTSRVMELQEFNQHYLKKENILFPYMEKKMEKFNGLAIMWALHDETRVQIKKVIECLETEDCKEADFNGEIGRLFFAMHGLIKKEELILFPAASEAIDEKEWDEMQAQSMEYGFPYIKRPYEGKGKTQVNRENSGFAVGVNKEYLFRTDTGTLNFQQLLMIFNTLPVDITFVDEDNKVRFYNMSKERLFPRSPAIIGREVEKCHPPESVHKVNAIIDAFRAGEKDSASFWINIRGKMLLIQYFALRDAEGKYRGVLEVSQDITGIKELKGERRLLQWEK